MNEDRGIYDRPPEDERPRETGAPYNALQDERPRMWRTFGLFMALMVSLLSITAYFLYLEEKDMEEENTFATQLDDLDATRTNREEVAAAAPVATVAIPYLDIDKELAADILENPTAGLDPDRMVEAMREVRAGRDYLAQREFDGAEMHCERALEIWPDMNVALRLLGVIYWQRGRFDDSILVLERALNGNPFSAEILNNMAMSYLQKRNNQKAQELLETALDLNPDFYITSLNLGFLYLAQRRYDLAAEYIEYGLDGFPENVNARNNLAVALMRLQRMDEAREHLRTVIEAAPGVADIRFNMAITYVMTGDLDGAMEWIKRAARNCTLPELQGFLADPDFDPIRNFPAFLEFIDDMFSG